MADSMIRQLLAEEAVHLEREHGVQEIEGSSSVAQGAALAAQQRFEEALPMLERSLGMLRSKGHPLSLAIGLCHFIAVLQALARPRGRGRRDR